MRSRRLWYALLFGAALPLGYACGVNIIKATATQPTPTLYAKLQDGTVRVDTFEVPQGRVCSPLAGRRDFCVDNLNQSMGTGLVNTLGQFMKPGTTDANYSVEYRLLGFQQTPSPSNAKAVRIAMRWKFELKRLADGEMLVNLDETTQNPQDIVRADLADQAVMSVVNSIFERIGAELGKLDLSGKPPEPPPPPPEEDAGDAGDAAVMACVPGATQECIGPGACKGGQACLPDGTGFTECDCGKKKKKGGAAAPKARPAPTETPTLPPAEPTP